MLIKPETDTLVHCQDARMTIYTVVIQIYTNTCISNLQQGLHHLQQGIFISLGVLNSPFFS